MASSDPKETRTVIKFCANLGRTPTQTMDMLNQAHHKSRVSRSLVFKWHKLFRDGRESIEDDPGRGRKKIVNTALVTSIKEIIDGDRRLTVRDIAEDVGVSVGTVFNILTDNLGMNKVSAKWVPRLLTAVEKERRIAGSRAFLRQYRRDGEEFLDRIITTDETWIWFFDPETKRESSAWKHTSSPPPLKARVQKSGSRYMFIMFMDRHGMLLCHTVPRGATVNSDYYSKVLRRDLVQALRKKRPDTPVSNFLLHQDNAPPHVSAATRLELGLMELECIPHPPYSPDLAPMDFAVFPEIKSQLRGQRFESLHELTLHTQRIISRFSVDWYKDIFSKWVQRHKKCIEEHGEYFEKK